MMKIVKIDKKNEKLFGELIFEPAKAVKNTVSYFGITEDGTGAGTAAISMEDGELRLLSLYVAPEFRGRGFAGAMIDELMKTGAENGALFITADLLFSQKDIREFLISKGFIITEDHGIYAFVLSDILKSRFANLMLYGREYAGTCKHIRELNRHELLKAAALLDHNGYPVQRVNEPGFSKDLSFCAYDRDGNARGVLICFRFGNDVIIDYLLIDGKVRQEMLLIFREFVEALQRKGLEEANIIFEAENEAAVTIATKLLQSEPQEVNCTLHAVRELF